MRIAIDIDSTLHDYWPEFEATARRRFGVELSYADQHTWSIGALEVEQVRAVVAETHSDASIARARPYPDAVATVNGWQAAGHFVHVTSHRAVACHPATARWLRDIGLRYDELHCSYDKLARCLEIGIELVIDDSPVTLARAVEHGLGAATLEHPWNRALCEGDARIVCAGDWRALGAALEARYGLARPQAR
jgi:uncharacterized protein